MKVFHTFSPSGSGDAQVLHTEMGVTILDDSYKCRYVYAQAIPNKPEGVIGKDVFRKGLEAKLARGERAVIQAIPGYDDSINYHVREIQISDAVKEALDKIAAYSRDNNKPRNLTEEDRVWVMELVSQIPEYIPKRIRDKFMTLPQ